MDSTTFNNIFGPNSHDNNPSIFHALAAADINNVMTRICESFSSYDNFQSILQLKKKNGDTCLHTAAKEQSGKEADTLISMLVIMGAEMDAQNNMGDTILHIAVKKKDYKLLKGLLEMRVDKDIRNKNGLTAYERAKKMDDHKSMKLILGVEHDTAE